MHDKIENLMKAVRRIAADNPDFIYEKSEGPDGCWYVRGGEFSCLIGRGLGAVGFTTDQLKSYEGVSALSVVFQLFFPQMGPDEDTSLGIEWLDHVQTYQDDSMPWHYAISNADIDVYGVVK